MNIVKGSISLLLTVFFTNILTAQSLDEILKKHFDAVNQIKLSTVQSVIVKGKLNQGGMEIPFTMYQKRPQRLRTEGTFQGMTVLSVYDGEKGWSLNPFTGNTEPQEMPVDQIDQVKDQAEIDGYFFNYEQKGYKLELLPDEQIEDKTMHVIKVTKQNNEVVTNYLDAETFFISKSRVHMKIQGVDTEIESYYSNFKPVEEIIYPFSIENKMNGQTMMQLIMDTVEFNKEVSDSLFSLPVTK